MKSRSPEEKKLREFNRKLRKRGWIDTDFLQGLIADRAMHIKVYGLMPHWKC